MTRADNPEILALAIYEAGGVGEYVDVEDIFVKAHQLSPDRFGWRTKPYPNYKSLSKALRDLEGKYPTFTVRTQDGLSRQLSAEGVVWIRYNLDRLHRAVGSKAANPATRRPTQRLLNELRDNSLFQELGEGAEPQLTRYNVAESLRCSPDSPVEVWRERMEMYRAMATEAGRDDLLLFLNYLTTQAPELFGMEAQQKGGLE